MILFLILLLICSVNFQGAAGQGECVATSCSPSGPIIRFPFRLKGRQPERCGYPGFELSCNPTNNRTEFDYFQVSAKATVQEIDYATQVIRISVLNGSCLPPQFSSSSSPSPFQFYINCSDDPRGWALGPIACLTRHSHKFGNYDCTPSNLVKIVLIGLASALGLVLLLCFWLHKVFEKISVTNGVVCSDGEDERVIRVHGIEGNSLTQDSLEDELSCSDGGDEIVRVHGRGEQNNPNRITEPIETEILKDDMVFSVFRFLELDGTEGNSLTQDLLTDELS